MAHMSSTTGWYAGRGQVRRDDMELVRAARLGDKKAFQELITAYDEVVLRLALHLTGSEQQARRIHEQVFLKAFSKLPTLRPETSLFIWIYRLAAACCQETLARQSGRLQQASADLDHACGELLQQRAIAALSVRERMAFVLVHYGRLRASTAAEILNVPVENVKDALTRAVFKLRAGNELQP